MVKVRIWGDKWILKPSTYMAHCFPRFLTSDAKVGEHIDPNTGWWNQELLANLFTMEEQNTINTIPINSTNQSDRQIWRCTATVFFLVKSAYHLVKEVGRSGQLEESIWLGIVKFGEFYGNYPSKLRKRILCQVVVKLRNHSVLFVSSCRNVVSCMLYGSAQQRRMCGG
jgi:hypothetical protein